MSITVTTADRTLADTELYYEDLYDASGDFDEYERPYDNIRFENPVMTDRFIITINRACAGSQYADTAISEIIVY